jgi:hypothetical protein
MYIVGTVQNPLPYSVVFHSGALACPALLNSGQENFNKEQKSYSVGWLDVTSTHEPTMQHSDPHTMSTKHSDYCDNFDPLTFYCDTSTHYWYVQVTNVQPPPLKVGYYATVLGHPLYYLPGLWHEVHFASKAKWECFVTCHWSPPGGLLACLAGMDKMSQSLLFMLH